MKHIASLALALLCAMTLASASGQPLRGGNWAARLKPATLPTFKAPPLYTPVQRATALAKVMSLTTTPPLGAPFSLTPGKPIIPGVAGMILNDLYSFGAPVTFPEGAAEFHISAAAKVDIGLYAQQGKRYAFDCRVTNTGKVFYITQMGGNRVEGEATVDANSHIVFATGAMQATDRLFATLYFMFPGYTPTIEFPTFWGCEIVPF